MANSANTLRDFVEAYRKLGDDATVKKAAEEVGISPAAGSHYYNAAIHAGLLERKHAYGKPRQSDVLMDEFGGPDRLLRTVAKTGGIRATVRAFNVGEYALKRAVHEAKAALEAQGVDPDRVQAEAEGFDPNAYTEYADQVAADDAEEIEEKIDRQSEQAMADDPALQNVDLPEMEDLPPEAQKAFAKLQRQLETAQSKLKERYEKGATPADRQIKKLKRERDNLRKHLDQVNDQILDSDHAMKLLSGFADAPVQHPDWIIQPKVGTRQHQEVPVVMIGDWHIGEKVSLEQTRSFNQFDLSVAQRRVRTLIEKAFYLIDRHGEQGHFPGVVLPLIGDFVSGWLHEELRKTDEFSPFRSAFAARDMLIQLIKQFADRYGKVFVPCVAGNHGRTTVKPSAKNYTYENIDWLIYQQLVRHFVADPEYSKKVTFNVPSSNEVLFRVYNHRFMLQHGDMMGVKGGDGIIGSLGPIKRGEQKVGQQARAMGTDFDTLLIGHFHHTLWLPGVYVNGCLKGWDEFAYKMLRASPETPSQSMFMVHPEHGITVKREINLEQPMQGGALDPEAPWVSLPNNDMMNLMDPSSPMPNGEQVDVWVGQ